MSERMRLLLPLVLIAAIAAVGIVETARSGEIGVLGLLCAIELVTGGIAAALWRSRVPVAVRADLASWLDATSAVTGETPSELANRALSAYRVQLSRDQRD